MLKPLFFALEEVIEEFAISKSTDIWLEVIKDVLSIDQSALLYHEDMPDAQFASRNASSRINQAAIAALEKLTSSSVSR